MNWDAIGAVGELVAAIATVATLAYLAVQIRQNTISNRNTNAQMTHDMILRANQPSLEDHELMDLLVRGMADLTSLDPVESARFHLQWMNGFFMYQEVFFKGARSQIEPYLQKGAETHMFEYLNTPGLTSWWQENRHRFAEDFRDYVDSNRQPPE